MSAVISTAIFVVLCLPMCAVFCGLTPPDED